MKATKKPATIDYFPLVGSTSKGRNHPDFEKLKDWINSFGDDGEELVRGAYGKIFIKTLEGTSYAADSQDVIIRGIKGEYYPCKKDIFFETYTTLT